MPKTKSELERYRDKRDPARTNEPFAEPRDTRAMDDRDREAVEQALRGRD